MTGVRPMMAEFESNKEPVPMESRYWQGCQKVRIQLFRKLPVLCQSLFRETARHTTLQNIVNVDTIDTKGVLCSGIGERVDLDNSLYKAPVTDSSGDGQHNNTAEWTVDECA